MQTRDIAIDNTRGRGNAMYFAEKNRTDRHLFLHRNRIFPGGHRRGACRLSPGLHWKDQRWFSLRALYKRHTLIICWTRLFPEVYRMTVHHETFRREINLSDERGVQGNDGWDGPSE